MILSVQMFIGGTTCFSDSWKIHARTRNIQNSFILIKVLNNNLLAKQAKDLIIDLPNTPGVGLSKVNYLKLQPLNYHILGEVLGCYKWYQKKTKPMNHVAMTLWDM